MSADSAATRSRQTKPKLHQIWFQKSKTASCLALFGNTISDFSNPVASTAHELVYFQLLPCRGTDRIRRLPPGTLLLRGCHSLWLGRCQQWIISACFGHDSAWPHTPFFGVYRVHPTDAERDFDRSRFGGGCGTFASTSISQPVMQIRSEIPADPVLIFLWIFRTSEFIHQDSELQNPEFQTWKKPGPWLWTNFKLLSWQWHSHCDW